MAARLLKGLWWGLHSHLGSTPKNNLNLVPAFSFFFASKPKNNLNLVPAFSFPLASTPKRNLNFTEALTSFLAGQHGPVLPSKYEKSKNSGLALTAN